MVGWRLLVGMREMVELLVVSRVTAGLMAGGRPKVVSRVKAGLRLTVGMRQMVQL